MKAKKWQTLHSSAKQDWGTPQEFFDYMDYLYGPFELDVAASEENAKVDIFLTTEGLTARWASLASRCWMNPPYGRGIGGWVEKADREARRGVRTCALLPARTDTAWFHDFCARWPVKFIRGRITFEGAPAPAPFPSMLVLFGYTRKEAGKVTVTPLRPR